MYTIDDAKKHVEKYATEIKESYEKKCPLHLPKMWEVWQSGCFLMWELEKLGCHEQERNDIGFAQGQRSLFGDPWEWAVHYLNEYLENGKVQDQPGMELADEIINKELEKR